MTEAVVAVLEASAQRWGTSSERLTQTLLRRVNSSACSKPPSVPNPLCFHPLYRNAGLSSRELPIASAAGSLSPQSARG